MVHVGASILAVLPNSFRSLTIALKLVKRSMATYSNGTAVPANSFDLLPKGPHLDSTFGAVLIGTFVGLM